MRPHVASAALAVALGGAAVVVVLQTGVKSAVASAAVTGTLTLAAVAFTEWGPAFARYTRRRRRKSVIVYLSWSAEYCNEAMHLAAALENDGANVSMDALLSLDRAEFARRSQKAGPERRRRATSRTTNSLLGKLVGTLPSSKPSARRVIVAGVEPGGIRGSELFVYLAGQGSITGLQAVLDYARESRVEIVRIAMDARQENDGSLRADRTIRMHPERAGSFSDAADSVLGVRTSPLPQ